MALFDYECGVFTQRVTTGSQVVSLNKAFTPKAVLFFCANRTTGGVSANAVACIGLTDGTNNFAIYGNSEDNQATTDVAGNDDGNDCLSIFTPNNTLVGRADCTALGSGSFTLNWDVVDGTARQIFYIALGGSSLSVKVGSFSKSTSTSVPVAQSVSGIGFQPEAVLMFMQASGTHFAYGMGWADGDNQGAVTFFSENGAAACNADSFQFNDHCFALPASTGGALCTATLASFGATSFNLSWDVNTSLSGTIYYLALRGVGFECGAFTQGSGTQTVPMSLGQTPRLAMFMNTTGRALFEINQYAYASKLLSVNSQESSPTALALSSDGTKAYVCGGDNTVYQYTLSTPWDISSGSYASKSLNIVTPTGETAMAAIAFSSDGTKLYALGITNDTVYQFTLSTPWDVSTGSYASKSMSVATQENSPRCMAFSPDGTKCYVAGQTNDAIYQYTLTTPWDISTGSYASKSMSVSGQEGSVTGIALSADGTKAFAVGTGNDTIYQYTLSTPFDISTGSYASKSLGVSGQDSAPQDIFFKPDGLKVYVVGSTNDSIYQYDLADGAAAAFGFGACDGDRNVSMGFHDKDGADPTESDQYHSTTACIGTMDNDSTAVKASAALDSFDVDEINLTWTGTVDSREVLFFAFTDPIPSRTALALKHAIVVNSRSALGLKHGTVVSNRSALGLKHATRTYTGSAVAMRHAIDVHAGSALAAKHGIVVNGRSALAMCHAIDAHAGSALAMCHAIDAHAGSALALRHAVRVYAGSALALQHAIATLTGSALGLTHRIATNTGSALALKHAYLRDLVGSALALKHGIITKTSSALALKHGIRVNVSSALALKHGIRVNVGSALALKHAIDVTLTIDQAADWLHRVADNDLARYELYHSEDGSVPDIDGTPFATFTSLPYETVALDPDLLHRFILVRSNAYGLRSRNRKVVEFELDAMGNLLAGRPSAPEEVALAPAAGGTFLVTAQYPYPADGADQADTWLIYLTTGGGDPDPDLDTPIEVAMAKVAGVAHLAYTSTGFSHGTVGKVVVRTRRSGTPDVDSSNTDIVGPATASTAGPSAPAGLAAFGQIAKQGQ